MPPDVRKVSDFPLGAPTDLGYALFFHAPNPIDHNMPDEA